MALQNDRKASSKRAVVAVILALAMFAASTSAILVRLVPALHPIALALWRTALAAALLGPSWRGGAQPAGGDLCLTVLAGLCLALHFWAWFMSLRSTTVMRSTVLVSWTPLWAGLLGWATGQDTPRPRFWLGIAVALVGLGISAAAPSKREGTARGDALATAGGVFAAAYLMIGRTVRQRMGIGRYGSLVCGACALWLALAAGLVGVQPWPEAGDWWVLLAMALGPQLMGHMGLNYALRHVPAATAGAATLLEPVGATLLAAAVLGELPTWPQVLGASAIIVGVAAATG